MSQGIGGALLAVALTGLVVVGIVRYMSGAEARARRSEGAGESASSGMFGEIVQPNRTHLTEEKERQRLDVVQAFAEYLSSGPPAPGPTTMTAEQAAERLRAFRAGEVRPRSRPSGHGALSHGARLRTLRTRLRAVDSTATGPDSWWSGPVEQAEDDLL